MRCNEPVQTFASNVKLNSSSFATLGLEFESQSQRSFNESLSAFGPSNGQSENDRWNRGSYGHIVTSTGPLSLNGGLRVEDNERFGQFITWQLGLTYSFSASGHLRGFAGSAIKEPTFFENYATGFARGNPNLDPERSSSWELGIDQELLDGSLNLHATYFDQTFRDLIQFTFSLPDPTDPNYFNVAEADSRGIEASATVLLGAFAVAGDFTWTDTEVVDAGFDEGPGASFIEGESLLRRPRRVLSGSVSYTVDRRATVSATLPVRRQPRRPGLQRVPDSSGDPRRVQCRERGRGADARGARERSPRVRPDASRGEPTRHLIPRSIRVHSTGKRRLRGRADNVRREMMLHAVRRCAPLMLCPISHGTGITSMG